MLERIKQIAALKSKQRPVERETRFDPPIRLMMGTCPGSRSDTEALARATVDRYFDMPQNAYFYIQKQSGVGHHFEIQEGGGGGAYLPRVVEALMQERAEVVISSLSGRQTRILMKDNGQLACSVLSEEDSVLPVTDGIDRTEAMTPIESTGGDWVKLGVMMFSLGLLTIGATGTIHKGVSLSAQGYYEVAEQFEPTRLIELLGDGLEPPKPIAREQVPLSQWRILRSIESNGRDYVTRLEYEDGTWDVEREAIELPRAGAPTSEPQGGSASEDDSTSEGES